MAIRSRLFVIKQLYDVMADPEFLLSQTISSGGQAALPSGGLEGLDQVAKVIMSGVAKLVAVDPSHYIYLLFSKPRSEVTFQSLALAQTEEAGEADIDNKRQPEDLMLSDSDA